MVSKFLAVSKIRIKWRKRLYPHYLYFFTVLFTSVILLFYVISMDDWQRYRIIGITRRFNYSITTNEKVKTVNHYVTDIEDWKGYRSMIKDVNSSIAKDINRYTKVYLSDFITEDGMNRTTQAAIEDLKSSLFHGILVTRTHRNPGTEADATFLTIDCNQGRLGNQMFTYAALLGLSNLNGRTPYAPTFNMNKLRPYFHLTAQETAGLPKNLRKEYKLSSYFRPPDAHIPQQANVLSGYLYPNSFTFFDHIRDQIKNEFRFREHIISRTRSFISELNLNSTTVVVGIHVRRTDYCSWLKAYKGRLVNLSYFNQAMQYFRTKFKRVVFVVISDDKEWCKKNLGNWTDVTVAPDFPEPAYDMALLSQCNHTIITYGTFGFWCAYLAGGETIYFAEHLWPHSSFLKKFPYNKTYLPQWIGISALEPNFWENYNSGNICK